MKILIFLQLKKWFYEEKYLPRSHLEAEESSLLSMSSLDSYLRTGADLIKTFRPKYTDKTYFGEI
jgi:hypothetical protein